MVAFGIKGANVCLGKAFPMYILHKALCESRLFSTYGFHTYGLNSSVKILLLCCFEITGAVILVSTVLYSFIVDLLCFYSKTYSTIVYSITNITITNQNPLDNRDT